MDEARYLHALYGPIANRPFPELIKAVSPERVDVIKRVFGWDRQRYLENNTNKNSGHVLAERSVWGHAATGSHFTEDTVRYAWHQAIKHKKVLKDLAYLQHKTKLDLLKKFFGVF